MNLYSFVLFSHIVATLGLFAGLAIECVTVRALQRAKPAEARIWVNLWRTLLPMTIASAVLVIASGIYLAAKASAFSQGWIEVSIPFIMIIALLGAVANKKIQTIGTERNPGAGLPPIVSLAVSCRTAIALGVVMIMTIKSDLIQSLCVLAIATAAGVFLAIVTRNVPRAIRPYERIEKSEAL